jgi:AraC family transcriptional regulator
MSRELTPNSLPLPVQSSTLAQSPVVDIIELVPTNGELVVPAVTEISIALTLSSFPAQWRDPHGSTIKEITAGTVSICRFNESRRFEMGNSAKFAVVQLRPEVLEQVQHDSPRQRIDLQAHDVLQDSTLRRLLKILLREKRNAFPSGFLFLDSVATALASYLVRHYSVVSSIERSFSGGMTPSILRRCVEFIETHLERELHLSELANEAGFSTSHFIRSFRQITGKTPHQYLLRRRVERAKSVMRDRRVSLTEVALASGFADQHHLARIFRRMTGLTPSSYRRSL